MMRDPIHALKERFYDLPIDLFCVVQLDNGRILHANAAFEYILGWKTEEIVGNTLDTFINTDEDRATIAKALSKIKLGVHSSNFETEFYCKNTQLRWIAWKGYVDSESLHLFLIGRDVTSYKEIQKTLTTHLHIDTLVGISNRQMFLNVLQKEVGNAIRHHYATATILLDIDHFREYNARYGFQKGDACLRQVALALKTSLRRKTDFLARLENDAFAVLLTHHNLEKAEKFAEYLHDNLEKISIKHGNESAHSITISLGVAAISESADKKTTSDQLLEAAARALLTSQQQGGNQVSCADLKD